MSVRRCSGCGVRIPAGSRPWWQSVILMATCLVALAAAVVYLYTVGADARAADRYRVLEDERRKLSSEILYPDGDTPDNWAKLRSIEADQESLERDRPRLREYRRR